jgi:hypothetical protein
VGGRQRDDHDRHLLAVLGQRRQQRPLTPRLSAAQHLVAAVELVKLQVHGDPPSVSLRRRNARQRREELARIPDWSFPTASPTEL